MSTQNQPDYYVNGDWNAYCARCGGKFKASQLRKQWQGYYVCPDDWEMRQPQDFVRSIREHPEVPWAQNPADIFVAASAGVAFQNNKLQFVQFVNNAGLPVNFTGTPGD